MTNIKAKIVWAVDKFKENPPIGRYVSVAYFSEGHSENNKWSVVADDLRKEKRGENYLANIRFLSPAGPSSILEKGLRFQMKEGTKTTAFVEIL
jgi:hypothetical protein